MSNDPYYLRHSVVTDQSCVFRKTLHGQIKMFLLSEQSAHMPQTSLHLPGQMVSMQSFF